MKQSSVADTKRKPSMLSLQSLKHKSLQQMTKHRETNLSRTLYLMLSKKCKWSVSFSEQDDSSSKEESKKRKIAEDEEILSTSSYLASFFSLDSEYTSASQYRDIPSMKLMKAWKSILDQVDWFEVMQNAEERERLDIFRSVFKNIVQFHIEKLLKQEECRKDINIEFSKRDDENIDIESENDSSENDDANDFRHFKNNIFLKSEESEYESENYTDDESDDEKDSDDKNQENDDCEMIDDWESI